jgi:hypothetical protein
MCDPFMFKQYIGEDSMREKEKEACVSQPLGRGRSSVRGWLSTYPGLEFLPVLAASSHCLPGLRTQ